MTEQAHIIVSGEVQGVSFRFYTVNKAGHLGLDGYVRNLPDGDVEIVAEGAQEDLLELITWARHGPPSARVSDVKVQFGKATGQWDGFRIRY